MSLNCPLESRAQLFSEKIIAATTQGLELIDENLEAFRKSLNELYQRCAQYLDTKFIAEIATDDNKKILSCLWEIILADYLSRNEEISIDTHRNGGPDWKIKIDGAEYYIEAVCAQLPDETDSSEIHRVIKELRTKGNSSWDGAVAIEALSRISSSIDNKVKKHQSLIQNNEMGYILCVSAGGLPLRLDEMIKALLPIGYLALDINFEGQAMGDEYFTHQDHYKKINSNSSIATNVLEKNSWISAVLISKVDPKLLLENSELLEPIDWKGKRNDFVLVHNPTAKHPLNTDIFRCRTVIHAGGKITGENIFPTFQRKPATEKYL